MSDDAAAGRLDESFAQVVEARGTPRTHAHGEIVDDAVNRERFPYAAALAGATGLDFVKLAAVELELGNHGLSDVIDALPDGDPARRLQSVHRLGSSLHAAGSEAFLAGLDGPDACLDALVESWSLRTAGLPYDGFTEADYPDAAHAAEATGLDFAKLAIIEHKGGRSALRRALERIPGIPPVDAV